MSLTGLKWVKNLGIKETEDKLGNKKPKIVFECFFSQEDNQVLRFKISWKDSIILKINAKTLYWIFVAILNLTFNLFTSFPI